jgi:probable rRNA maturation factor
MRPPKLLMPPLVETVIEAEGWSALGLPDLAERAARAALAGVGLPLDGYAIALLGCDDARIAGLNAEFRGKALPTNVLSWPSENRAAEMPGWTPDPPAPGTEDLPEELGDIALAYETCRDEASAAERKFADHVTHLVVHGVLHLLGYDHESDRDAAVMESLEIAVLAELGIESPY